MRTRSQARELALKFLFGRDITDEWHLEDFFAFAFDQERNPKAREFAHELCKGALDHRTALVKAIEEASDNWSWRRMGTIDRNLLLLGAHEILDCPDIPPSVTINEIVELAKRFGGKTSASFVNGVLDTIRDGMFGATRRER